MSLETLFHSRHVREIIVIPLLPKFFPGEVTWVRISFCSAIGNRVYSIVCVFSRGVQDNLWKLFFFRFGPQCVGSPRKHPPLLPPMVPKIAVLSVSLEAQTTEFASNNDEGTKPAVDRWFTTISSAVYQRDEKRSPSWLLTNSPTSICFCKPFPCKACPGTKTNGQREHDNRFIGCDKRIIIGASTGLRPRVQ